MTRIHDSITGDIDAIVAAFQARAAAAETPSLRIACIYMAHFVPAMAAAHDQMDETCAQDADLAHGLGAALASLALSAASMVESDQNTAMLAAIQAGMNQALHERGQRRHVNVGTVQ